VDSGVSLYPNYESKIITFSSGMSHTSCIYFPASQRHRTLGHEVPLREEAEFACPAGWLHSKRIYRKQSRTPVLTGLDIQ